MFYLPMIIWIIVITLIVTRRSKTDLEIKKNKILVITLSFVINLLMIMSIEQNVAKLIAKNRLFEIPWLLFLFIFSPILITLTVQYAFSKNKINRS